MLRQVHLRHRTMDILRASKKYKRVDATRRETACFLPEAAINERQRERERERERERHEKKEEKGGEVKTDGERWKDRKRDIGEMKPKNIQRNHLPR